MQGNNFIFLFSTVFSEIFFVYSQDIPIGGALVASCGRIVFKAIHSYVLSRRYYDYMIQIHGLVPSGQRSFLNVPVTILDVKE